MSTARTRTVEPATGPAGQPPAASPADPDRVAASAELSASFKALMAAVRRRRGRETRRPGGLSDAQYGLLFGLRDRQQLSSSELASLADLSHAAATEMLEGLEAAGLVRRERSERDRRVVLTSLTDRGHALLEEHHARYAPRWYEAISEFSNKDLRTSAAVLDRLRDLFDDFERD